jgi:hypothetical protein
VRGRANAGYRDLVVTLHRRSDLRRDPSSGVAGGIPLRGTGPLLGLTVNNEDDSGSLGGMGLTFGGAAPTG